MKIIKIITQNDINEISKKIAHRQDSFSESLQNSVELILLNYGVTEVRIQCTGGEWSGARGDLQEQDDPMLCPFGHPLFETSVAPRLALIRLEE